jgi:hypothetical protein
MMKTWGRRGAVALVVLASVLLLGSLPVTAQAPAQGGLKRTVDGKPDLNGIWQIVNTAYVNLEPHHALPGMPGGMGVVEGGEIPYKPEALARRRENFEKRVSLDPVNKCFLPGVPRVMYMPYPFQIAQTPKYLAMAFEFAHAARIIYTDGSPHPPPLDFWMGDSRGKWEGDTLVVETTHFNGRTWLDMSGNHHSENLKVLERFMPTPDGMRMNYEVTIEDPQVFTRPWKMSMPIYKRVEPNLQLIDYDCVDHFWVEQFSKKR